MTMMEPKFLPFLTEHTKKTEHGYEYIELSKDTPQELMNEYMDFVMEQDQHCKNHERITSLQRKVINVIESQKYLNDVHWFENIKNQYEVKLKYRKEKREKRKEKKDEKD